MMKGHWLASTLVVATALVSGSCESQSQREAERRRAEQDRTSAAFKVGQAAHEVANEAARVGAAAARKLDEDARKAREGWKEQGRKDRDQK